MSVPVNLTMIASRLDDFNDRYSWDVSLLANFGSTVKTLKNVIVYKCYDEDEAYREALNIFFQNK